VAAGIVVQFALVNVMEAMTRFSGEVIVNERVNYKADYIRVNRERRVEHIVSKPDRPETPESQPEPANVTPDLADASGDQGLRNRAEQLHKTSPIDAISVAWARLLRYSFIR
jgi:hypothetical protein